MKTELETITPARAKELLDAPRPDNRQLAPGQVNMLTRVLREGAWKVNGDTIKLGVKGELLDGQHRLMACVNSGVPLTTLVAYGVPEKAMGTMDTHKPRTAADNLAISGYQNVALLAACVRKLVMYATGSQATKMAPEEVKEILRLHAIQESCRLAAYGNKGLFTPASLGAIHYIGAMIQGRADASLVEKANAFMTVIKSGVPAYDGDPAHVAREYVISKNSARFTNLERMIKERLLAHAWGAFSAGRTWKSGVRNVPDVMEIPGWTPKVCFGKQLMKSFEAERKQTQKKLRDFFKEKNVAMLDRKPPLKLVGTAA
jgi:hypothetical protein